MSEVKFAEFPEIDTSYWLTKDKEWVADRKSQWLIIEPMLLGTLNKSKKGITIIKRYYLKGTMPDFDKLKKWESDYRHLDLFCFLWLHPSWDEIVLTELRNAYVYYRAVLEDDVNIGVSNFLRHASIWSAQDYEPDYDTSFIAHSDGHNELLFKVLLGDLTISYMPEYREKKRWRWQMVKPTEGIEHFFYKTMFLCNKYRHILEDDYLYQYPLPMEYWYMGACNDKSFFIRKNFERNSSLLDKALYRIHHFDVDEEGDTARSRFVLLARKMLNEREFAAEFKQRWLDVKSGKIVVEDAWSEKESPPPKPKRTLKFL